MTEEVDFENGGDDCSILDRWNLRCPVDIQVEMLGEWFGFLRSRSDI